MQQLIRDTIDLMDEVPQHPYNNLKIKKELM